jgi:hypothetical protein
MICRKLVWKAVYVYLMVGRIPTGLPLRGFNERGEDRGNTVIMQILCIAKDNYKMSLLDHAMFDYLLFSFFSHSTHLLMMSSTMLLLLLLLLMMMRM